MELRPRDIVGRAFTFEGALYQIQDVAPERPRGVLTVRPVDGKSFRFSWVGVQRYIAAAPAQVQAKPKRFPLPWYFEELRDDARTAGFIGSDEALATRFVAAVEEATKIAIDVSDDWADSGIDLLRAVSQAGGFRIEAEHRHGMRGELKHLMESLARYNRRQPEAFRRSGGLPGIPGIVRRGSGLSVDAMRETIQEDPRWADRFDSMSDFLEAVFEAVSEAANGTAARVTEGAVIGVLRGLLGVRVGSDWWAGL